MKLSAIIQTQEDFEKYIDDNEIYRTNIFSFIEQYHIIFWGKYTDWGKIYLPSPEENNLVAIMDLKETIMFMWFEVIFN